MNHDCVLRRTVANWLHVFTFKGYRDVSNLASSFNKNCKEKVYRINGRLSLQLMPIGNGKPRDADLFK